MRKQKPLGGADKPLNQLTFMNHVKHLHKSNTDKIMTGLIGGIAEYFTIDSSLLRLVWILLVVFTGIFPGVIAYILGSVVVPDAPVGGAGN